jgi:hypothetical protein
MSLLSSGKETSRGEASQELSQSEDGMSDDEDMEALLASCRRKKPRLKNPTRGDRELSPKLTSERTERTPLLKGKTSLRPRQRSLSTSVSPTAAEKKMELGRTASNDFYTPKRKSLSHAGHSRSGESSVFKSNRQNRASASGSSSKAPLQESLPFLPSTAAANSLSLAPRDHNEETIPPRTIEDDSSESSSEEGYEGERQGGKPTDSEEKNELSKALKDMTSVLNVLVKKVESNSNEIHALKTTLRDSKTPSSSSDSSSGSRKQKVPAVVRV